MIKAEIWVSALIRRAESAAAFACVLRRGDPDAGACLVLVTRDRDRAILYMPARDEAGELIYLDLSASRPGEDPTAIAAWIERRLAQDPDLWLVEIEDRAGRHFITEPVHRQSL